MVKTEKKYKDSTKDQTKEPKKAKKGGKDKKKSKKKSSSSSSSSASEASAETRMSTTVAAALGMNLWIQRTFFLDKPLGSLFQSLVQSFPVRKQSVLKETNLHDPDHAKEGGTPAVKAQKIADLQVYALRSAGKTAWPTEQSLLVIGGEAYGIQRRQLSQLKLSSDPDSLI